MLENDVCLLVFGTLVVFTALLMVVGSTLLDGCAVVVNVLHLATVCDFLAFVEIV